MALNTLTGKMTAGFAVTSAQVNITGSVYNPVGTSLTITKNQTYGTSAANSASGGCDEVFSFQQSIASSSSATISLIAMTDLLQRASTAIVRIKGYMIRLLSAADDSSISPAPSAATSVTVTNIGPEVPAPLDFGNAGSGLTVAMTVSAGAVTGVTIGTAGSGYPRSTNFFASPQQAGGSGCLFMVTTDASGVPTAVTFITGAGGAGYSAATVPTVPVGQYNILTGGFHAYGDPSSTGFCVVSSTAKNITIINMSTTAAATVEIDVFGATS